MITERFDERKVQSSECKVQSNIQSPDPFSSLTLLPLNDTITHERAYGFQYKLCRSPVGLVVFIGE
jgi:hypothetical protein